MVPPICHAPGGRGDTGAAFGEAVSTLRSSVEPCAAGLPPSLRERLRENLLSVRAFIAKRLAKAVFGAAFIAPAVAIIAPRPASLGLSAHAGS